MENRYRIKIASEKISTLNEKIDFLNKKLKKIGKQEITTEIISEFVKSVEFTIHFPGIEGLEDIVERRPVKFAEIEINAPVFSFSNGGNEYEYLGSIQFTDGTRMYHILNEKYTDEFLKECICCDHCHIKRKRNEYYLFRKSDDDKIIRIGSKCAKEYFGYDIRKETKIYLETYIVISQYEDEKFFSSDLKKYEFPFNVIYESVKYATNNFSFYCNGSSANPTAAAVRENLTGLIPQTENFWNAMNKEIYDEYEIVKDYWNSQNDFTEFNLNAKETFSKEYANQNNLGIAVFGIFKAMNEHKKKILIEEHEKKENKYRDGERITVESVISSHRRKQGYYGTTHLLEFYDGNEKFMTRSTSRNADSLKTGEKIKITGTVSGKDSDGIQIVTILTRCKFTRIPDIEKTPAI